MWCHLVSSFLFFGLTHDSFLASVQLDIKYERDDICNRPPSSRQCSRHSRLLGLETRKPALATGIARLSRTRLQKRTAAEQYLRLYAQE